ncbi:hypothetical protein [Nostoc sp. FACHB-133]|uniref:hypothetical protein n=1 Tax=Nostoc sp. FACHB-133 TaxID=2692835 RepID=UPI0016879F6B|nr:hypothetical protein [Nostoc sp. FACHB-133]MBD2521921.1 hypothetical protein [Nostoc sp. FACHB-133]
MSGYVSNLAKTGKISPIKGTELFQIHWLTVLRSLNPLILSRSRQKAEGKRAVGGSIHQEYWILVEDLPEFNRNIVGLIEVISQFRQSKT